MKMPQLQAILSQDFTTTMSATWTPSPASCSQLKLAQLGNWQQWRSGIGEKIVTLSLPWYDLQLFGELEKCSFPALRQFRVFTISSQSGTVDGIFRLLRKIGSNLHSLQLGMNYFHHAIPEELWEVCPRLERFDSTLSIVYPPPEDHPLSTMSFFMPDTLASTSFSADLKGFRCIRHLIAQDIWKGVKNMMEGYGSARIWISSLIETCDVRGVTLEDATGVLIDDSFIRDLLYAS
jgi:hypothetical protein